jgi:hypothetical protein
MPIVRVIEIVEEAPAASGGAGCAVLIGLFMVGGMLYEAYQWFLGILPTLMMIGGCIIGLIVLIGLIKAIGLGKTIVLAAVGGGAFGIYAYFAGVSAEREMKEYQEKAAVAQAEKAEVAAKVEVAANAERAALSAKLSEYFTPESQVVATPALLIDIHQSYRAGQGKRRKSEPMTVSSSRIEGLVDKPITAVKFFKKDGAFTFAGAMEKYSGKHSCYGSVEYNKRGRQVIFAAYCLKDDHSGVETAMRYIPVKLKKKRKGLEKLFSSTQPAPWTGLWLSSDKPCAKKIRRKKYTYIGRTLLSTNAPFSDLDLFMLQSEPSGALTQFAGIGERYRKPVQCSGSIEPVGKVKQATFKCSTKQVDGDAQKADGNFAVTEKAHPEQSFYLCKPLKRFP